MGGKAIHRGGIELRAGSSYSPATRTSSTVSITTTGVEELIGTFSRSIGLAGEFISI
jgi:hypothetical protein